MSFNKLITETTFLQKGNVKQLSMLDNLQDERLECENINREKKVQKAVIDIKKKYGKNSILKGMNFCEGATTKDRNEQIGGHKA